MIFNSCEFLDAPVHGIVQDENYFKNEQQVEIALNGVYAILAETGLYGSYMIGRLGLDADEAYNYYTTDVGTVSQYAASPSDNKILSYWRTVYYGISRANLLLDNIDKPRMDSVQRANIKGQTIFLRAYYYSMLVTRFGNVPLVVKLAQSGNANDVLISPSPAKEVYEFIIAEMEKAAELVPEVDEVESPGRVSKSVVWGMLARMNLYMAGNPVNDTKRYEDAAFWAKKVIDSGKHKLNPVYKQVFINYAQDLYDYKESIWEVEFWGNNTGIYTGYLAGSVGLNNGILNTKDLSIGYSNGILRVTTPLYNLYAADGTDLRRDWSIAPYYYTGNPGKAIFWNINASKFNNYCGKFRRENEILEPKSSTNTPQNFPLLRYSDVLLMYAEAVNRKAVKTQDETNLAYSAVNQVRRRAYGADLDTSNSAIDFPVMSEDAFFAELQNERSRELSFECLRKNDLIRWGIFYEKMKDVLNYLPSGTSTYIVYARNYFENVGSRDVLWPIPSYEMGVNPYLNQNKDW